MPASFGELLRERRIAASLTQEKLAEMCHLSPKTVAALEQGRRRAPRLSTVKEIADALGLSQAARTELAVAAAAGGASVQRSRGTGGRECTRADSNDGDYLDRFGRACDRRAPGPWWRSPRLSERTVKDPPACRRRLRRSLVGTPPSTKSSKNWQPSDLFPSSARAAWARLVWLSASPPLPDRQVPGRHLLGRARGAGGAS